MKILEFQGKKIIKKLGINIPNGVLCKSIDETIKASEKIKSNSWIIKAQILAGGRGKAGGVKIVKSVKNIKKYLKKILNKNLITNQTNEKGINVKSILIEEKINIKKEWYISFLIDRQKQKIVLMASREGGVNIEEAVKKEPNIIHKIYLDPSENINKNKIYKLMEKIFVPNKIKKIFFKNLNKLYDIYIKYDFLLLEINPFVLSKNNKLIAVDIKIDIDNNALFRHPKFLKYKNLNKENKNEKLANKLGMSYVPLNGNIGCLVNGAGLAMATMDCINFYGGKPANFLDIGGGGASINNIKNAFKIMLNNKKIKVILINIFGGIIKCDTIAIGLIKALKIKSFKTPIVARIKGTNEKIGKKLLIESKLPIFYENKIEKATKVAINISNK